MTGRRRQLTLALAATLALILAAGASGEAIVGYTAAGSPGLTKPSTQAAYSVAFTNTSGSRSADAATIAVPTGFTVDAASVHATATCGASTWTVESPVPTADGKIAVRRPGGSQNNLCPGGTLTVAFSATSSAVEGTYEWTTELFRDTDTFVLAGAQPSVTVDGTAPVVVLTSNPSNPSNATAASFAFAANEPVAFAFVSEPGVTLRCKLDDAAFTACASPQTYGGLGDGRHTFAVTATDGVGNVGPEAARSWTIETRPPVVTVTSGPPSPGNATTATLAFSANEPATFECKLDGRAFAPCASPKTYRALARGRHSFTVRAADRAGNVEPGPPTARWSVTGVVRRVAASALFAPAAGARVTRPPLLRWRPVRRATYYNVQLYRAGRKLLSTWPRRTKLQLRSSWRFAGQQQRLTPGTYRWYVWPGYGPAAARKYGRMLGTSTFVVTGRRSR